MAKYIDAEKIKFDLSGLAYIYPSDFRKTGAYFIRQIRKIPTADVRENVHGEWIEENLDNFRKYKVTCSICKSWYIGNYDAYDEPCDFNFCPNCGADMRGNENGNTQSV